MATVVFVATFLTACGDPISGPGANGRAPRDGDPDVDLPTTREVRVATGRDSLLEDLTREALRTRGASRMTAEFITNGARQTFIGPRAISQALASPPAPGDRDVSRSPGIGRSTAALVEDDSSFRIRVKASLVMSYASHFEFKSYTEIDTVGTARYTFTATRTVFDGKGAGRVPMSTKTETQTLVTSTGYATATWPKFELTSGCDFSATLSTSHKAEFPWGFFVSGLRVKVDNAESGGSNELTRDCGTMPPPPPPDSQSLCDDPSAAGCPSGSVSPPGTTNGGFSTTRERGRSGGYKTVCYVTDWYENGVYVETTIDRCWSEPIW